MSSTVAGILRALPGGDKLPQNVQILSVMRFPVGFFAVFFLGVLPGWAQSPTKLRVGVFERPPFAMKDADGRWNGLAVEVWERVSAAAGLPFEFVETSPEQVFNRTARGELDVIVGEVGVSSERERIIDFVQPYLTCPVAAAVKRNTLMPHWGSFLAGLVDDGAASTLLVLVLSLFAFAVALWLIERRVDRTHFGGKPLHGFGSALWFAAVTMTTVGYGDKTPQSVPGRAVVLFWMFLGVVIVSVFTGTIASGLTLARAENTITRAGDLNHFRSGVLKGSAVENLLAGAGIRAETFGGIDDGLRAVNAGKIAAFVGGEISLRYAVNQDYPGKLLVVPLATSHLTYAFAVRPDMPANLREMINAALIDQTASPGWEAQVERWIGPPAQP